MRSKVSVLGGCVLGCVAVAMSVSCADEPMNEEVEEEVAPFVLSHGGFGRFGHHRPRHRPHHDSPHGGQCTATSQDGVVTVKLRTGTLNETSMSVVASQNLSTGHFSLDKKVRRRGVDLIVSHDTGTSSSMQADVHYSFPIRGIREATGTSDGATVEGMVDGRAIVPHAIDSDPNLTQFADGQPPPRVFVPFGFVHTLRALAEHAEDLVEECSFEVLPSAEPVAALTVGNAPRHYDPSVADVCLGGGPDACERPGEPRELAANDIDNVFWDLCWRCTDSCLGHAALESLGCLFVPFVFGCEVAVVARGIACGNRCYDLGGQCCPVDCGGTEHGEGCCATGTQCLNATAQTCCYSWEEPCGGKECCFGTQECVSGANGPQCCEPCGTDCCNTSNDYFCKTDQSPGQCCKQGQECGTVCCAWNDVTNAPSETCRAPNLCCGIFTTDCNGTCCDLGQVCTNGQCAEPPPAACLSPNLACSTLADCITRFGDLDGLVCSQGCCYKTLVK